MYVVDDLNTKQLKIIIQEFTENCFKISQAANLTYKEVKKIGAISYLRINKGTYKGFNVQLSNGDNRIFYREPWIVLLKDPNTPKKGIYPEIYFLVHKDYYKKNGGLTIEVCYGTSKVEKPSKTWPDHVIKKHKTQNEEYQECYIEGKPFVIKDMEEYKSIESDIIEALDKIINEYNSLYAY